MFLLYNIIKKLTEEFDLTYLYVISVIFFSNFIRAVFGFGNALIAMPLLAFVISPKTATPLVAVISLTISLFMMILQKNSIQIKSAFELIISSLVGIPLGIYFLKGFDIKTVNIFLGIIIILFSVYNLTGIKNLFLKNKYWSYFFGIIAGILGGAYNTNGPPVVIYGVLKGWSPEEFTATLQSYFFFTGIFIVIGHVLSGNYTDEVLGYYIFSLPAVFIPMYAGIKINKKFSSEKFRRYIYYFLIITSFILIYNAFR